MCPAEWPRPPPRPGADPASPKPVPAPLRRALAAGSCLVRNGRGAAPPAPGGPASGHRTIACEDGGVSSRTRTTNDEHCTNTRRAEGGREAAGGHGKAERWTAGEARSAGPRRRGPASCPCPGQLQRGGAAPPRPCAYRPKRWRPARQGGLLPPLRRVTRMSPDMRCRSAPFAQAQARRARRRGGHGRGRPAGEARGGRMGQEACRCATGPFPRQLRHGHRPLPRRRPRRGGGAGRGAGPLRAGPSRGRGGHERRPRAGRGRPPASEGRRDHVRGAEDPVRDRPGHTPSRQGPAGRGQHVS